MHVLCKNKALFLVLLPPSCVRVCVTFACVRGDSVSVVSHSLHVNPAVMPTWFLSLKQSESVAFHHGLGTVLACV